MLFLVVGRQDSTEHLAAVQGSQASLVLVQQHALRSLPTHVAGGSEVVGVVGWGDVYLLTGESQILRLVSVEIVRYTDALTVHL